MSPGQLKGYDMKKITLCLAVLLMCSTLMARERKEYDSNLIYDEDIIQH